MASRCSSGCGAKHAWRAIPVIVVTAKDLTREEVERLNGRVVKVLQKGTYRRRDLLDDVRALLAGREVSARRRRLPSRLATDCRGNCGCPSSCMSRTTR